MDPQSAKHAKVKVGSRKSKLAMIQTEKVIEWLKEKHQNLDFEVISMTTTGDKILDTALAKIGEKNLFTKELENALLDHSVDFVVHSLKDLPTALPAGLVIGAVCKRDDPRDAVVMRQDHMKEGVVDLSQLPDGSVIGTSSLRRAAQLKRLYPNLSIVDVRGNLNTRLKKLDEDTKYDCLILALAGLERMEWHHRVSKVLDPNQECMFAVSQGAMAVECREGDERIYHILQAIQHPATTLECVAERAFLKTLEGGCSVPIAVYSKMADHELVIRGGVFSIGGEKAIIDQCLTEFSKDEPFKSCTTSYSNIIAMTVSNATLQRAQKVGQDLAQKLLKQGAREVVDAAKNQIESEILEMKAAKQAEETRKREAEQNGLVNAVQAAN